MAIDKMQLHRDCVCKELSALYYKVWSIFPSLEIARPQSKPGIQALCSLHISLVKAKNILQHCFECSELYLAIIGDAVLRMQNLHLSIVLDAWRTLLRLRFY
ncbi:unnamed protein product [Arabidopsis halleri]